MIYVLYRGTVGEIGGERHRVWADFPALQLCWAKADLPARAKGGRVSLLELAQCEWQTTTRDETELCRVDVSRKVDGKASGEMRPVLRVVGPPGAVREFAEALRRLIASHHCEGRTGLEFIQKRLFQYLWQHQGTRRTEEALYEAQAVLAFNLEPKSGIAYVRSKLGRGTDDEIGKWLARMSTQTGGLDPTMLGTYFSRIDTVEVFKSFVDDLDFEGTDIVSAMRKLFDAFKPGGEGQVITRILESFSEAYFLQWQRSPGRPKTAYKNADSVLQIAVSLIMLNTGLHVATKKIGRKAPGVAMSLEEYVGNVRQCVDAEEVPEEALKCWYDVVKENEIAIEPMPRVAFASLPVQPNIEGWLIAVLGIGEASQRRYWAVLALQRLYLFSDASEVEPADAIDLKEAHAALLREDEAAEERYLADTGSNGCGCLPMTASARKSRCDHSCEVDCIACRGFEVRQNVPDREPKLLANLSQSLGRGLAKTPRARLVLVAETRELSDKWVSLIQAGPHVL